MSTQPQHDTMIDPYLTPVTRQQAVGHLTTNGGRTRGSRYGRHSDDMIDLVWRHSRWHARQTGQPVTLHLLNSTMALAVNDHPDLETDLQQAAAELAGASIDQMVDGYLACQLWAQPDVDRFDDGLTLDEHYGRDDVGDEYVDVLRTEFSELVASHPLAVRMYLAQRTRQTADSVSSYFGHDYYLTREHHGTGFWDRGLGELGEYLTTIAHAAGAADELVDDGQGVLR